MTQSAPHTFDLAGEWRAALGAYLSGGGEEALARAYEIGRTAASSGIGILDVVAVHHEALASLGSDAAISLAGVFLAEGLSPFEMIHRAYRDANDKLEQLNRDLRDARRRLEIALTASEKRFERLSASGIIGIFVADAKGTILEANDAFFRMTRRSRSEVHARRLSWVAMTSEGTRDARDRALTELAESSAARAWQQTLEGVPVLMGAATLDDGTRLFVLADLTEQKRTEKVLHDTEEQLRQAQKMDAIGRLAGGVAHDFNNLLTVIMSYSRMLLREIPASDPLHEEIAEIAKAGERASDLTRQLLAFSRQQVLQPTVLDTNQLLSGMVRMLQRLLGEDIELSLFARSKEPRVFADAGQLEQVVMNLAVNARDAMPKGGKLTIATSDVVLDEAYAREHLDVAPGEYVMLDVSDTGTGMDKATQTRIFEPFFTTKEKGKGTGLGLAMVFGIVKQSGGSIWVYSEVGKGTSFKIYLPRAKGQVRTSSAQMPAVGGTETILLVEDDEAVRRIARIILTRGGYKVLEAEGPEQALAILHHDEQTVHVLVTDVVMPHMSGRELAERVLQRRPGTRVLFMSGYTDDAVVRNGALDASVAFIQKPLTPERLLAKVREVLA